MVSWADRVAYTAHDFEDAVHTGIVSPSDLPDDVAAVCGRTRGDQLGTFVGALVECASTTGVIITVACPETRAIISSLSQCTSTRI